VAKPVSEATSLRCLWLVAASDHRERAARTFLWFGRSLSVSSVPTRGMPGCRQYNAITRRLKKLADYEIIEHKKNKQKKHTKWRWCRVFFRWCQDPGGAEERGRGCWGCVGVGGWGRADGATFCFPVLAPALFTSRRQTAAVRPPWPWHGHPFGDEYNKWKRDNPQAPGVLRFFFCFFYGASAPARLARNLAKKLRRFRSSHTIQVILLNQPGRTATSNILRRAWKLFRQRSFAGIFRADPEQRSTWRDRRAQRRRSSSRRSTPKRSRIAMESWGGHRRNPPVGPPPPPPPPPGGKPAIAAAGTVCGQLRGKPHDAFNLTTLNRQFLLLRSKFAGSGFFRDKHIRPLHLSPTLFSGETACELSRREQC